MPREVIEIGPISWWRLALFSIGGKERNKSLLADLSGFNLALADRAGILSSLNLNEPALGLLADLAALPEGGHSFSINKSGEDVGLLAELGLVILSWPKGKIRLSDAGRFALSLSMS